MLASMGMAGILLSLSMIVNLLVSMPVQGKMIETVIARASSAVGNQQSIPVNDRVVYALPITTGPIATAVLQGIPENGIAYIVHTFDGRGKSVSTALYWFHCGDIVSVNQYNGNQTEIEIWALLTEQERLESQAACSL